MPFSSLRGRELDQKRSLFVGNRGDNKRHLSLTGRAVIGRSVVPQVFNSSLPFHGSTGRVPGCPFVWTTRGSAAYAERNFQVRDFEERHDDESDCGQSGTVSATAG